MIAANAGRMPNRGRIWGNKAIRWVSQYARPNHRGAKEQRPRRIWSDKR